MSNFYDYELKKLYDLFHKKVDDLDIPNEQLQSANISLARDISFYLK